MDQTLVLKALADETRMNILALLLQHNYCARALARKTGVSEAAVSQHLKVLREADLLVGEKKGYFTHYNVNRNKLHELAADIESLAASPCEICLPEQGGCTTDESERCHNSKDSCLAEEKDSCRRAGETYLGDQSCRCSHHRKDGE